jgi:hypothetical protein
MEEWSNRKDLAKGIYNSKFIIQITVRRERHPSGVTRDSCYYIFACNCARDDIAAGLYP